MRLPCFGRIGPAAAPALRGTMVRFIQPSAIQAAAAAHDTVRQGNAPDQS